MRTQNFFKALATFVAIFGLVSMSNAQVRTSAWVSLGSFVDTATITVPANEELTEYTTVGSKMLYYVNPDPAIQQLRNSGVYKPSEFLWNIAESNVLGGSWTVPASNNYTINDTLGAALTLSGAGNGNNAFPYTLDSMVTINWKKTGTGNAYRIWMQESPVSNTAGVASCPGLFTSLNVHVLAKPTIQWTDRVDSAMGGCSSVGVNQLVKIDLTGSDNFKIVYDSTLYTLAGAVVSSGQKTVNYAGATSIFVSEANSEAVGTAYTLTNWVPLITQYGYVKYTVTHISDRISKKSLANIVANNGEVASYAVATPAANVDGTQGTMTKQMYRVFNLPTPTSRPVKHVTNLGW
jgi:hypothetical protein